ncbi:MAG: endonuclease/exonuclease/phosphatase family protein [Pirellulales bacterium]|nr:endonuclease/exonuclease/phosphatase family protein [Pirellulales bacterium]
MPSALRLPILAVLLTALQFPAPAAARPLRILTYNIHNGAGRDGVYNLQRIADVINAANPDLVALQEVEQGTTRYPAQHMQLDELAARTGMTGIFGKTLNRLGGEYGNGVLINPEFELINTLNHTMPNPADGELRKVMEIRLRIDDDGSDRRVNFFATHMDHTSSTNRQAQVDFINDLVDDSNIPGVLAGDFNFDDQGPAYVKLLEQWVDPTAASPGRPNQIDYVVNRGADQWSTVTPGRFIVNATTDDASDHYPLLAVLELQPYTADFNNDGDVDGADFLTWQRNVGGTGPTVLGDANHDRVVNAADRAIWSQQFGTTGSAALAAGAIPEPATVVLAAFSLVAAVLLTRFNSIAIASHPRIIPPVRSCRR